MKTIWKYEINISDEGTGLTIPADAQILDCKMQKEKLMLWVMVDTEQEKVLRKFRVFGTGHELPTKMNLKYIATVKDRVFMWHVFEIVNSPTISIGS